MQSFHYSMFSAPAKFYNIGSCGKSCLRLNWQEANYLPAAGSLKPNIHYAAPIETMLLIMLRMR